MAIDPRIAMGVQPAQIQSPVQGAMQAMSLRNLMGEGELRNLQLQEARDARERRIGLQQLLSGSTSTDDAVGRLTQGGFLSEATALQKQAGEAAKLGLDNRKGNAELAMKMNDDFSRVLAAATDQQSYQRGLMAFRQAYGDPADRLLSQMPPQFSPEMQQEAIRATMIAKGQIAQTLPQNERVDIGGAILDRRRDPITGQVIDQSQIGKTATPDALMTDARMRSEGAANRDVTMRGQNMVDARERQVPRGVPIDTPNGIVLVDPRGGTARVVTGADGRPVASKEQAKASEAAEKAVRRRDAAIAEANTIISRVDDALDKVGMLTTGLPGAVAGRVPGTTAYDLRAAVQTIQANLGFEKINAMREMSPTGGALGNVTERELAFLQSAVANLDASQSEAQLVQNLQDVRQRYANVIQLMQAANQMEGGGGAQQGIPQGIQQPGPAEAPTFGPQGGALPASQGGGATGGWDQPTPQQQSFSAMPPARNFPGAEVTDQQTGTRWRSDGKRWMRIKQ